MELVVKDRFNGHIIASGLDGQSARIFVGNWYYAPGGRQHGKSGYHGAHVYLPL